MYARSMILSAAGVSTLPFMCLNKDLIVVKYLVEKIDPMRHRQHYMEGEHPVLLDQRLDQYSRIVKLIADKTDDLVVKIHEDKAILLNWNPCADMTKLGPDYWLQQTQTVIDNIEPATHDFTSKQ